MRSFPLLCLAAAAAAASVHATPIKAKWGQDMDVVYLSLSVSCVPHTRNVTISNSRFSFQCTSRTSRDEVALAFDFREPMDGSHPKTGCKVVKHGGCGVAGPAVAGRHVLVPSGVRPAACAPPPLPFFAVGHCGHCEPVVRAVAAPHPQTRRRALW